jgi:nucleoside-diphosphate-sugar epimerase
MDVGRKVILLPETFSNWLWGRGYVENIAAAICHFLSKETQSSAVFNLGDPVALSQKEWVEQIAGIAGWTGEILIVPDEQLPDKGAVQLRSTLDDRREPFSERHGIY